PPPLLRLFEAMATTPPMTTAPMSAQTSGCSSQNERSWVLPLRPACVPVVVWQAARAVQSVAASIARPYFKTFDIDGSLFEKNVQNRMLRPMDPEWFDWSPENRPP